MEEPLLPLNWLAVRTTIDFHRLSPGVGKVAQTYAHKIISYANKMLPTPSYIRIN